MPVKKTASRATGASSSRAPTPPPEIPPPTIIRRAMPRYTTLINPKMMHKIERRIKFTDLPAYHLDELFESIGLNGLLEVWESPYCVELVNSFIAHLVFEKRTGSFRTEVQGTQIQFTAAEICETYNLPHSADGVDVYDAQSKGALKTDEALRILLGPDFRAIRTNKVVRSMLIRNEDKLLTYILHFNVMPRGGKANDEVPHNFLQFICAARRNTPINFEPIIKEGFTRLAKKNVRFVAYHKLITRICVARGVGYGPWDTSLGEILDKKKMDAMRLPIRPTDDTDSESEDSEDEGDGDDGDGDDDDDEGRQDDPADQGAADTEGDESDTETLAVHTRRIRDRAEERHQAVMSSIAGLRTHIDMATAGLRQEIRELRRSNSRRSFFSVRPSSSDPGPS